MRSNKKTSKEYEQLGRAVSSIFESGYLDKHQAYKTSFIKGMFSGLGGVLGATILVALLVWFLSFFGKVPLLGKFVKRVNHTVQSTNK
jgi:hypothetical protein